MESNKILIIGHRGASNSAPENTLKAFQKAIDLNADFIEFDLHETKDGELVIIHDEDVSRITGKKGLVKEMSLHELQLLDFGEGERIPTLQELIALTKGKIQLNCEIKVKDIGKKTIKILHDSNMVDSTIISSFDHQELLKIQKFDPLLRLGSLEPTKYETNYDWNTKKEMIQFCVNKKLYAIHPLYPIVDQKFVDFAHKNNVKVFPWTVDSKAAIRKLVKFKVDGIITNNISKVMDIIND